jgi:hypothetical protein
VAVAGALALQNVGALAAAGSGVGTGSGVPQAAEGLAGYSPPAGPELTSDAVEQAALRYAAQAGDTAPAEITESRGTFAAAQAVLDPGSPLARQSAGAPIPGGGAVPASGATSAWLASSTDLVLMHGHFTANLPVPMGHTLPSGTVYALILDAHTGFPEARYIGNSSPDPAALGAAATLVRAGVPVAEAATAGAARMHSGIVGQVRRGSARGAWRVVVVAADVQGGGRVLASTRTDREGRFVLAIKPGRYLVEVWPTSTLRCLPSTPATVRAWRNTRVEPRCTAG